MLQTLLKDLVGDEGNGNERQNDIFLKKKTKILHFYVFFVVVFC